MTLLIILSVPVGWAKPNLMGGAPIRTVEILKRWYKLGAKFVTLESPPFPSLVFKCDYTAYRINFPVKTGSILTAILGCLLWLVKAFCRLIRWKYAKRRFSVVVSSGNDLSNVLPAFMASKLFRVPLIIVFHDIFYKNSFAATFKNLRRKENLMNSLFLSLSAKLTITLVKRSSLVLCVSSIVKRILQECGVHMNRIKVTDNGVDIQLVNSVHPLSESYEAAFLGRVETYKGVPDLLKAWKVVAAKKKNAKLIIVGSGNYTEEAHLFVRKNGLKNNVFFAGFIPGELKYRILKSSKLFVYPSKGFEGWGMVVAEAMACGLPVVCYRHTVLEEIYGGSHCVTFVPPSIKELSKTILKLLGDAKLRHEYAKKCRSYARKFDWNEIAKLELQRIQKITDLSVHK